MRLSSRRIHINKEYFAQAGIPLEDGEDSQETEEDSRSETDLKRSAELSRELDEDYFQWKEQQEGSGEEPDHRGRERAFPCSEKNGNLVPTV